MPELKITSQHLQRDAYLYIRQSTPRQVLENTESTQRQYALRDRAVMLGWPLERIHVLDSDLGKSGSQSAGRDGFQRLVSEVALGKAGIVMGLEVSRLARNSADWHRLIELCRRRAHSRRRRDLRSSQLQRPAPARLKRDHVGSRVALSEGSNARWRDQQGATRRVGDAPARWLGLPGRWGAGS